MSSFSFLSVSLSTVNADDFFSSTDCCKGSSHAPSAMAASPSSGSMVRNQSGTDVGNGNGDVHKVDPHRSRAKETIGENSKKKTGHEQNQQYQVECGEKLGKTR